MSNPEQALLRELLQSHTPGDLLEALRLLEKADYPSAFLTHLIVLQTFYPGENYKEVREKAAAIFKKIAPRELQDFLRSVPWREEFMTNTEMRERYLRHLTAHPMIDNHTLGKAALHLWGGDFNFYIRTRMLQAEEVLQEYCLGNIFYLYNTPIESLPDELGNLSSLQCLLIRKNKIKQLPQSLGLLLQLRVIDASENDLQTLPDSIKYMKRLHSLHLAHNHLHVLPPEIGELHRLRKLCLKDNKMRVLSYTMQWMECLEYLDLSQNPNLNFFQSFEYLKNCPQLKEIKLRQNNITAPLRNLHTLKRLESIDLSKNPKLPIEETFAGSQEDAFPKLKALWLDGCSLSSVASLQQNALSQRLERLSVAHTGLQTIDIEFPALRYLDCSYTDIEQISPGLFPQLRELHAGHTPLQSIPACPELQYLSMDGNQRWLEQDGLQQLKVFTALETLSLKDCRLETLSGLENCKQLRRLSLDGCTCDNWETLLLDIYDLAHLRSLSLNAVRWEKVPQRLARLRFIEELSLEQLPESTDWERLFELLTHLPRLKRLHLGHNPNLKQLPAAVLKLKQLEYLDLSYTGIRQLPRELSKNRALQKIKIDGVPNAFIRHAQIFSYDWFEFSACAQSTDEQTNQTLPHP